MNTTTAATEPGHEVFQALGQLEHGAWKIKANWRKLGLGADIADRSGWVHVENGMNPGETALMWTSGRETHSPAAGPAHSLTIDQDGRLVFHASSILGMHVRWARGAHNHTVGDEYYLKALEVARALHKSIVIDQRATLVEGLPSQKRATAPTANPSRKPPGP